MTWLLLVPVVGVLIYVVGFIHGGAYQERFERKTRQTYARRDEWGS